MSLTKADLVERVHKDTGHNKKESENLVASVFSIIKDTLSKGENVKISEFGNFNVRDKSARVGRNPKTGEEMKLPARRVVTFKSSQVLIDDIISRYGHRTNNDGKEDESIEIKEGTNTARDHFRSSDE